MEGRLRRQLAFLQEIDKLKSVSRATPIHDNSRPENAGEHSWHIAMYALVLAEHAEPGVDVTRVIRMLLVHDIVEIDAGDVPIHAATDPDAQAGRERIAAERLFGLLPRDQARELRALWDEFEAARTPDAVFAKSIDRVQPVLLNHATGGGSWREYGVTLDLLEARVGTKVRRGAPALWEHVRALVAPWFARNGG